MGAISGIYEILHNSVTAVEEKKFYIGRATNLKKRWQNHKDDLRANKHHSVYLQRSWNLHGEAAFSFVTLEIVVPDKLKERELFYLTKYDAGFNMILSVEGVLKHTEASRKKMTAGQLAHWQYKRSIGNDRQSEETKKRIAASHIGIRPSAETRAKQSASAKKRPPRPKKEFCKQGHPLTPDNRKKDGACLICTRKRAAAWAANKRLKLKKSKKTY